MRNGSQGSHLISIRQLTATAAVAAVASLAGASPASGATIRANLLNDAAGACAAPPNCTLRQALTSAANNAGPDTVRLRRGTYLLTIGPDTGVNSNLNGDLDYADLGPQNLGELTIDGVGPGRSVIDASGIAGMRDRVLQVDSDAFPIRIRDLSLTGGNAQTPADLLQGGALYIDQNSPTTISDVVITGNRAADSGGGVAAFATAKLERVTLSRNVAVNFGGGVLAQAGIPAPAIPITNSTIFANAANTDAGGGIANFGDGPGGMPDPALSLTNSTLYANKAGADGGAIDNFLDASADFRSVTVVRNQADSDNAGGGFGGGLQNAASFRVEDSLIADNAVGTTGAGPDCSGAFVSGGGNIRTSGALCGGFVGAGDILTANPLIAPLADNGGPTQTVALLAGSPAIDYTSGCPAADQRGLTRVGGCDTGAYDRVLCLGVAVNRFGGKGNDTINGTGRRDGILGLGGNDSLRGKGARDGICAGRGNDRGNGGGGRDRLVGRGGRDQLSGGRGADRLSGGRGRDRLIGGPGKDVCHGGPGKDRASGCEVKRRI